ncbi:helix-turn-helix transcriptional regulator [Kitasatospora sp. NPDC056731]|uniref:helix-turn-helix domain-containing protein n=1 Tax=Kitasatospora sp. NPDC056731 TaxID=3155422 RepID=UPI00343361FC
MPSTDSAEFDFNVIAFRSTADAVGDTSTSRIAVRTGLNRGLVARLRNGSRQPNLRTAARIAAAYKVSLDDLVVGLDDLAVGGQAA